MVKVNGRKLTKSEEAVKYIWEQTENWLHFRFKREDLLLHDIIEQTGVTKKYNKYSFVIPKKEPDTARPGFMRTNLYLIVDKRYMLDANKEQLLEIAGRTAMEIIFMVNGKKFKDNDEETKKALYTYGLPIYGNFPHQGLTLHQYTCSSCNKIITLQDRKIPQSRDIAYNPKKLSSCCNAIIKYDGRVEFSNEDCQKLEKFINTDEDKKTV